MMARMEAEEQLAMIMAGRVAQGAGDEKGRAAVEEYIGALQRRAEGLPPTGRVRPSPGQRLEMARAFGLQARASGRRFDPLRKLRLDAQAADAPVQAPAVQPVDDEPHRALLPGDATIATPRRDRKR